MQAFVSEKKKILSELTLRLGYSAFSKAQNPVWLPLGNHTPSLYLVKLTSLTYAHNVLTEWWVRGRKMKRFQSKSGCGT